MLLLLLLLLLLPGPKVLYKMPKHVQNNNATIIQYNTTCIDCYLVF